MTLDSESLELLDGRDRKFGLDTDNLFLVPGKRNIFFEQVNPGVTKPARYIHGRARREKLYAHRRRYGIPRRRGRLRETTLLKSQSDFR